MAGPQSEETCNTMENISLLILSVFNQRGLSNFTQMTVHWGKWAIVTFKGLLDKELRGYTEQGNKWSYSESQSHSGPLSLQTHPLAIVRSQL